MTHLNVAASSGLYEIVRLGADTKAEVSQFPTMALLKLVSMDEV
jgi:hypothetical protein